MKGMAGYKAAKNVKLKHNSSTTDERNATQQRCYEIQMPVPKMILRHQNHLIKKVSLWFVTLLCLRASK